MVFCESSRERFAEQLGCSVLRDRAGPNEEKR